MDNVANIFEKLHPVDFDAGEVFSGKSSGSLIKGYATPCAYTPKMYPDYMFHESFRDIIVWLLNPTEPLYVYGPQGCGKSSSIKQLAAKLNYPVFEVTAHGRLEFGDLIGHLTVQNGNMSFEYGPLSLAMRYGGIFLLNEIDLTSPDIAAGLNGILDGSPLCIPENGGELIVPNPMFRFVATANTNGGGDETGLYQGTQRQNAAFADRFILCEMGYPDSDVEQNLLQKTNPLLPAEICRTMVAYANEVRKLFMGESSPAYGNQLEITFSTRSLLRWANLTIRYQPLARQGIQPVTYALDRALAFRASRESRAMLHELAQRMFPENNSNINLDAFSEDLSGEEGIRYLTMKLQNLSHPGIVKVHLRKTHASANGARSKDWICEAKTDGLLLAFGRSGTAMHSKIIRQSECRNNTPLEEFHYRTGKKLQEGYVILPEKCQF